MKTNLRWYNHKMFLSLSCLRSLPSVLQDSFFAWSIPDDFCFLYRRQEEELLLVVRSFRGLYLILEP